MSDGAGAGSRPAGTATGHLHAPRGPAPPHLLTAIWAIPAALLSATIGRGVFAPFGLAILGLALAVVWFSNLARVLLDREARGRLT